MPCCCPLVAQRAHRLLRVLTETTWQGRQSFDRLGLVASRGRLARVLRSGNCEGANVSDASRVSWLAGAVMLRLLRSILLHGVTRARDNKGGR